MKSTLYVVTLKLRLERAKDERKRSLGRKCSFSLLELVPLNPIVWCYVWYYIWHYVWLNVVINKVVLLLSKIMVTWIFEHYHIVYEMQSMWFMWFSHRRYESVSF